MARRLLPIAVVLLLASACAGASTPTTVSSSTTLPTPLTTLAPHSPESTTTTAGEPTTTTTVPPPTNTCVVGPTTSVEGYTQGCKVLGFEILAPADVDPQALWQVSDRIFNMLLERPDLATAVADAGINARVVSEGKQLRGLPEFGDLYRLYPGTDWDRVGRSFPGTDLIPLVVGAEENLLCLDGDRYDGDDQFVRAFALTIRRFGMTRVDPGTDARIEQAYSMAMAQRLWVNTLAEINSDEYWVEGTQSYFDVNLEEPDDRPPNSSHNQVDTREELRRYDPMLFEIARSVYGDTTWRPTCP